MFMMVDLCEGDDCEEVLKCSEYQLFEHLLFLFSHWYDSARKQSPDLPLVKWAVSSRLSVLFPVGCQCCFH